MSEFGQPNQLGESGGSRTYSDRAYVRSMFCAIATLFLELAHSNILSLSLTHFHFFFLSLCLSFLFFFFRSAYYLTCLQAAVEYILELQQPVTSSSAAHTHVAIPSECIQQNIDSADAFFGLEDSITQVQSPTPTPVPAPYGTYSSVVQLNAHVLCGDKSVADRSVADESVADRNGVVDTDNDSYEDDSRIDKTKRRDDGYAAVLKLGEWTYYSTSMHAALYLILPWHAIPY